MEQSHLKSFQSIRQKRRDSTSWDEDIPFPAISLRISCAVVASVAAFCFYNSLNGDFVFDDSEAVVNNNDIRTETSVVNILYNDFWGTRLTHPSSHKSYRPLTVLSFRVNYMIGGLHPYNYHVCNVILHCIVSVLALKVFAVIFGPNTPRASFLSCLLFASHPIHTEAVSGIVGRADLLCALFVFIAFLSYVNAIKEYDKELGESIRRKRYMYMCFVGIFSATAMLCKEVGITALGLCSAYDVFIAHSGVVGKSLVNSVLDRAKSKQLPDGLAINVIRRHTLLLLFGIFLLMVRWNIMGSTVPKFMTVDNPASFLDSAFFRAVNYQYIYTLNLLLLILPVWLCFDWSMGCIPVISQITDVRLLVIPLLWLAVGLFIFKGLSNNDRCSRYIMMSLSLGIIPFLPASNLFFRVGFVIAERVLYIPVAGLCILIVTGLRELNAYKICDKRLLQGMYVLIVAVFIMRCRQRNEDWLSEKQLFKSGLDVCPLNAKVHYNMGKVAADSGDTKEAVRRYREALRLNTHYDQAMNNLANILKDQGQLEEALRLLKNATSIRTDFAAAWMNLGIVQASLGQHSHAQQSYLTALSHRSVYPDCFYNLGNLYLETGQHAKAIESWTKATTLKPTLAVAWTNMLIFLDSDNQFEKAVQVAYMALKHLPNEATIHFNLANTLGKLTRYDESEKHFLMATKLEPSNANYWSNLGVLYHRWKKYELAEQTYRHTLKVSPNVRSAQDNLNMLLKTMGKINK